MTTQKILSREQLASQLDRLRKDQRIVFTNGCFDILHVGHIRLLEHARALGDVLVVGMNSDASVQRLKGPSRPVVAQDDRAEVLAALASVSFVTIFDEDTPIETLQVVKPHVHVKGGDYRPEDLPESNTLQQLGARIEIFPTIEGRSSSRLIERTQKP